MAFGFSQKQKIIAGVKKIYWVLTFRKLNGWKSDSARVIRHSMSW